MPSQLCSYTGRGRLSRKETTHFWCSYTRCSSVRYAVRKSGHLNMKTMQKSVFASLLMCTLAHFSIADSAFQVDSITFTHERENEFHIPYFPSYFTDTYGRSGLIHVVNLTASTGDVEITAYAEDGSSRDARVFELEPNSTLVVSSVSLESGSEGIGELDEGHWRLIVKSSVAVQVLSYIQHFDRFLSSSHDVAPHQNNEHRVFGFLDGESWPIESQLRIINPNDSIANVTVNGIDSRGEEAPASVSIRIPPQATQVYTGRDLEADMGQGTGAWRLTVSADMPIFVMHLHQTPTGRISNLSTIPLSTSASTLDPTDPPESTVPVAPTITFTGLRRFTIEYPLEAVANVNYATQEQARLRGEGWQSFACEIIAFDDTATYRILVNVTTDFDLEPGHTFQARYRIKESDSCDAGEWSSWSHVGEATYMEDDDDGSDSSDNRYDVGETITNMPTGFFGATLSGGSMVSSGGVVTITLSQNGYVAAGDYRWTCDTAGGCRVVDRVVELGTIVETLR